jgi:signal transduction histidine kinase
MNRRELPTVLVVSDREADRCLISQMLRSSVFDVLEATDGSTALARAREAPDAIVLDVQLPDVSGHEVCRRLKAAPETEAIPVLLTWAAHTAGEKRVEGLEAGADGYLVQPFEASELSATLRALLRIRAAERDAKRLARDLAEAVKIRDDFMSIASHELKTPLTSLGLQLDGIARLLRGREHGGESTLRRKLASAIRQTDRLGVLIDDLLAVSAISQGRFVLEPAEADLEHVVQEVVDGFQEEAARANSTLTFRSSGPLPLRIDAQRIGRVVQNLVSNALKYGCERPVEVTLGRANDQATVTVRDHGIGIAPEDRERIFGRFERAVSVGNYGGLGMGLYIGRQIIEAHGGRIHVEPADDHGSRFVVELPIR